VSAPTFTYLSLGAGVQSSAMLVCSALGLHGVPRADAAVFADVGDEPGYVYDYLFQHLVPFGTKHGIPVHVTSKGRLSDWVVGRMREGKRFITVPLFTVNADGSQGMLRRQCTREFKVEPIQRWAREYLGYRPRYKVRHSVTALIGISIDEASRMKPSRVPWITNWHPLVDAELSRRDCLRIIREAGLPEPQKSACVFCPYHSDGEWLRLQRDHPNEFFAAVRFDAAIRDGTMRGRTQPGYVHRSCKPLDQVDFDPNRDQYDAFDNECEGLCGV
jgi:hypothetical protein